MLTAVVVAGKQSSLQKMTKMKKHIIASHLSEGVGLKTASEMAHSVLHEKCLTPLANGRKV